LQAGDLHHRLLCFLMCCFLLVQVTSTTDINWFAQQTNYRIIPEAAEVTAQMLLTMGYQHRIMMGDATVAQKQQEGHGELPLSIRDPSMLESEKLDVAAEFYSDVQRRVSHGRSPSSESALAYSYINPVTLHVCTSSCLQL
jgi:hypothetical protein